VSIVLAAIVLMIVSRLNIGLKVADFKAAAIAAVVIAVIAGVITWFLGLFSVSLSGDLIGAIVALIVAAVVLLAAAKFVPGLEVKGFGGAIIAAIGIAVVTFLGNWFLGLFGL
jgi:putative membrane protein